MGEYCPERGNFPGWVEVAGIVPSSIPSVTRFRIQAIADPLGTGATYFYNDLGVDDFFVREAPVDEIALISLDVPTSGCGLSNSELVSMTLVNRGSASQTGFPVTFQVDAQTAVTETVSSTMSSGDTLVYTFTAGADLSAIGSYSVLGYVDLATDEDRSNDSTSVAGFNSAVVSSFPYSEDFANGAGNWFTYGANNTWELGTPANSTINSAASDTSSWITNRTGDYNANELSFVESPCFDLSSIVTPGVSLNIWTNTEADWDGAVLQFSTDAGLTWSNVGSVGNPNNWYNDNSINGLGSLGSQDGWSGTADTAYSNASNTFAAGGQANVKLRVAFGSDGSGQFNGFAFDDVNIVETALINDLSVASVDSLSTDCGLSATSSISATIINVGIAAQSGFDVSYVINGGTPVTETVSTTINSGDTLIYTFTATADFSTPQVYDIDVYQTLVGDGDSSNDTASTSIESLEVPVLTTSDVSICAPQNVTLIASATIGDITWFDASGNVAGTGDSLDLGLVSASQTYTIVAIDEAIASVGAQDSTIGAGGYFATGSLGAQNLLFTASQAFILDSVTVFSNGAGDFAVILRDDLGNNLDTVIATSNGFGPQQVPVGIQVPGPGNYQLGSDPALSNVAGLWRNSAGASYPYTIPNIVSITGNTFAPAYYYFFFDWKVRVPGCNSPVDTVNVNFGQAPTTSFTWSQTASQTLSFVQSISPTPDSVLWNFGDGNTDTSNDPTHTYALDGSYTVTLTAYLDGCDTTVTEAVFTTSLENLLSSKVTVYPNPTEGQVVIESADVTFNAIEVKDMLGNTVMMEEVTFDTQTVIEMGSLPSGNYLIRLISEDGVALKRIALTK